MIAKLKELEEQSRRPKKMYAEERLKAEITDWLIRLTKFDATEILWLEPQVCTQDIQELELNLCIKPRNRLEAERSWNRFGTLVCQ
mgnify:CR=1 FL=1|tara:strand:+ start:289 stop:546 length:258 start_codon:yes stop_codon:yes gene_type:complete